MILYLFLSLLGCESTTQLEVESCVVVLSDIQPATGQPGDTVSLTVSPLTTKWDTAAFFGSTRGEVTELVRDGCDTCDACRATQACTACGDCDACDAICQADCVESLDVVVPKITSGIWEVFIYNSLGTSTSATFEVESAHSEQTDTGETDTESGDTGQ